MSHDYNTRTKRKSVVTSECLKTLEANIINNIKEELYNTINSHYKYTSIPKSSFYKINILMLHINIEEKYPKYSIYFASICDYQPLSI